VHPSYIRQHAASGSLAYVNNVTHPTFQTLRLALPHLINKAWGSTRGHVLLASGQVAVQPMVSVVKAAKVAGV
jgi:hypothetical protein